MIKLQIQNVKLKKKKEFTAAHGRGAVKSTKQKKENTQTFTQKFLLMLLLKLYTVHTFNGFAINFRERISRVCSNHCFPKFG